MIYCKAILTQKAGLGIRLLPWARCRVFSHINNIPMLEPRWAQIRLGPLVRRESDLRIYNNLFKRKEESLSGIKQAWIRCISTRIDEPDNLGFVAEIWKKKNSVVVFEGWKEYFSRLKGWNEMLYQEIRKVTKYQWLKKADSIKDAPIGIHIRMGDFLEAKSEKDFFTIGTLRTPLSWFKGSLEAIRKAAGFSVKAFVVSDGREDDLKELLMLKDITLVREGSAISDLLTLSKAKVLIASGGSTFSAWASFLGQMPTISHPGQSLEWFGLENKESSYVGEFDLNNPNELFINQIKRIFLLK